VEAVRSSRLLVRRRVVGVESFSSGKMHLPGRIRLLAMSCEIELDRHLLIPRYCSTMSRNTKAP